MWLERRGQVRAIDARVAPLSGQRCVLYRVELTLLQRLSEFRGGPSRERSGSRFHLVVGGLELLVEPRGAELGWHGQQGSLAAIRAGLSCSAAERAADDRLRGLYARLGRGRPRGRVRLREWQLPCDAQVEVSGWLRRVPDLRGDGDYRLAPQLPLLEAVRITA